MRLRKWGVVGGITKCHETDIRQGHGDESRLQRQSRPHLRGREKAFERHEAKDRFSHTSGNGNEVIVGQRLNKLTNKYKKTNV